MFKLDLESPIDYSILATHYFSSSEELVSYLNKTFSYAKKDGLDFFFKSIESMSPYSSSSLRYKVYIYFSFQV